MQSEILPSLRCSECGTQLSPAMSPACGYEFEQPLCFDCASRRFRDYELARKRLLAFPERDALSEFSHPR